MLKRSVATIIAALSIPLLGGVAIAVANSVDTNPAPASVTHATVDDKGGVTGANGTDDPATHDVNDDHGGVTGANGTDDPATHDVNDDHGGVTGANGTDDAATTTTTATVDDHGGVTGGGIDDSSGHGGGHG